MSSGLKITNFFAIFLLFSTFSGLYAQQQDSAYLETVPDEPEAEVQPEPLPSAPAEKERSGASVWGVGASLGTSFSDPWFIGTVLGTFAPKGKSFFELGIDFGLGSTVKDADYYSLYPYAHYALLVPFPKPVAGQEVGWYGGGGFGYLISHYNFPCGRVPLNLFAVDLYTGFRIADMFDISYTFRTNFAVVSNKVAVGYTYRFK